MSKSLKNYITIKVACLSGPPRCRRVVEAALAREAHPGPRVSPPSGAVPVVTAHTQAHLQEVKTQGWDHINSRADCSVPWVGLQLAGVGAKRTQERPLFHTPEECQGRRTWMAGDSRSDPGLRVDLGGGLVRPGDLPQLSVSGRQVQSAGFRQALTTLRNTGTHARPLGGELGREAGPSGQMSRRSVGGCGRRWVGKAVQRSVRWGRPCREMSVQPEDQWLISPVCPHQDFLRSASPDVFHLFCLRSSYRSGELAAWPRVQQPGDPETQGDAPVDVCPAPGGHRSALRPEPPPASAGPGVLPPPLPRPEPGRMAGPRA